MNQKTIIALKEVVCVAGDRPILEIDNLKIVEGERIAVLGANGAGKSTLLRLVGGLICPHHGVVRVLNRALSDPLEPKAQRALRRDVGQIMQGLHLVPRLTAIENVLIGCLGRVNGWHSLARWYPPDEIKGAKAALNAVGMISRTHTRADRLSGGERQKVAIARLLMQRPRLILADEPTAALDPAAAADVCQVLVRAAAGATLITVVHNPSLLPVLADRAIGIKHGAIVFDCPVADVTDERLVSLYRPGERDQARFIATTAGGQLVSHMGAGR
ncbi:MAG: ATP-binding cassette domain-containing protein [Glaciimonas sp.]|nr:ATP-binding cassette domain-containing protein [Glaciimonas sp.]